MKWVADYVSAAQAECLRYKVRLLENQLTELLAERRRVETLLTETEDGRYANNSWDYGRGMAFLARRLRENLPAAPILSTNPNTGGTVVPFTLDPLVKTNYPPDKELPYFVQAHEDQLPQQLVELDDDWIRSTLDELVVLDQDPLYWTARRGRFFEPDPARAYLVSPGDDGSLRPNRLLLDDGMWNLMLWTELTDPSLPGEMVVTSVLAPWSSDLDMRIDMVRQAVQAIMTQLDRLDERCRNNRMSPISGRIRLREA